MISAMEGADALVGRQAELEAVGAALADPVCTGVLLRGSAGVGKTRLALECLELAAGLGFSTLRVAATPTSQSVPLGALAPLLPPLGAEPNPLAAARAALLEHRPDDGRLLLMVDDAQWLDDTSATLLHQAVDAGEAFGLLTVRDDDGGLPAWVRTMWASGPVRQVPVGPMSDAELTRMAAHILGGEVDPALTSRAAALAGGNAFTLHELVIGAQESGAVDQVDGIWTLTGPLERSDRVVELVRARLTRLSEPRAATLALASVATPLPVGWLTAEQLDHAAALEAAGLVEVRSDGGRDELWVSHPLYAEVVRAGLGALQRRGLLAEVLDQAGGQGLDEHERMRVALWSLELDRAIPDEELVSMARLAYAAHRIDLAVTFLDRVGVDRLEAEERYLLLGGSYWLGDAGRAEALFERMRADATTDRERALVAIWDSYRAAALGDAEGAVTGLDAVLGQLEDEESRTRVQRVQLIHTLGRMGPREVVAQFAPLLDAAEGAAAVALGSVVGMSLALVGRTESAIAISSMAADRHRHLPLEDPDWSVLPPLTFTLLSELVALVADGRFEEVDLVVEEIAGQRQRSTSRLVAALSEWATGFAAFFRGEVAAVESLRAASDALGSSGSQVHPPWTFATSQWAIAAAQLGDAATARRALDLLEGEPRSPSFGAIVEVAAAWVAATEHRRDDAAKILATTVSAALDDGSGFMAAYAAWSAVRLGVADRLADPVDGLPSLVDGGLVGAWAEAAVAARSGDADGLEQVADRLAAMGARIDAAEAFAVAARLWSGDGRSRQATGATRRARELLGGEVVRTPNLVLTDDAVPLTDREREVADLAAEGLPAKVIAERLFISQRTVTNHLQHVYDKLGVSSRAELRAALGRD